MTTPRGINIKDDIPIPIISGHHLRLKVISYNVKYWALLLLRNWLRLPNRFQNVIFDLMDKFSQITPVKVIHRFHLELQPVLVIPNNVYVYPRVIQKAAQK